MVRRLLNELKWHPEKTLEDVRVTYIHRGVQDDKITIDGGDIKRLEKSFFVIERGGEETFIPYHRISKVQRGGETLYRKKSRS